MLGSVRDYQHVANCFLPRASAWTQVSGLVRATGVGEERAVPVAAYISHGMSKFHDWTRVCELMSFSCECDCVSYLHVLVEPSNSHEQCTVFENVIRDDSKYLPSGTTWNGVVMLCTATLARTKVCVITCYLHRKM